jgi:DNA-binding transcriptional ArsR family regulator
VSQVSVYEAIADPTRRQIIDLVSAGEMPAGEIALAFDVSRPAISRHLRVLRESGLLTARGEGQRRLYRLDPSALSELESWIDQTRLSWSTRLSALDDHLKAKSTSTHGRTE